MGLGGVGGGRGRQDGSHSNPPAKNGNISQKFFFFNMFSAAFVLTGSCGTDIDFEREGRNSTRPLCGKCSEARQMGVSPAACEGR